MHKDWLAQRLIETPRWHLPVGRRACTSHPATPARDRCDRCGRPFCDACLNHVGQWRVCGACVAILERERFLQRPPQRLRRGWTEIAAAIVIVLLIAGTAGLIQHLLGSAASDAGLASVARGIAGAAPAAPASAASGHPTLQLGGRSIAWGSTAIQAHVGVSGSGFQPDERVQLTAVWSSPAANGATVTRTLGPFPTQVESDGTLTAYLDLGRNLPPPAAGAPTLRLTATGDRGSTASLETVLPQPPTPTPRP